MSHMNQEVSNPPVYFKTSAGWDPAPYKFIKKKKKKPFYHPFFSTSKVRQMATSQLKAGSNEENGIRNIEPTHKVRYRQKARRDLALLLISVEARTYVSATCPKLARERYYEEEFHGNL
ncbi:hypothetical protein J3458_014632 [Metarhizium acridum]|uniref:uncharacterized protein n=1 Tax=Metarhizium acridum TaxID=92637 RepID=UPI001C6BEF60|nr:hypothetical protein J3458_014632 [Metarhizium acridum]